jgi:general secretion pathway protein M
MYAALPDGRRGQILAIALTVTALAALWLGIAAPLIDWYQANIEALTQRQALLRHMQALADTLPALEHSPAAVKPAAPALLSGATDALAAAAMQSAVQAMAAHSGAELASMETLPAEPRGAYRRIGLRVSLTAPWPVVIELIRAAGQGQPRMLVDDVQLRVAPVQQGRGSATPIGANFTLLAFRAANGAGS